MHTLEKRHIIAINKLRAHLFGVKSPADHSLLPQTEEVIAPTPRRKEQDEDKLGGLRYYLNHPLPHYVEIRHFAGRNFDIVIFEVVDITHSSGRTKRSTACDFSLLPNQLHSLIKGVLTEGP